MVVNQKAILPLYLVETDKGGKKEKQRAELLGPEVGYYIAQPDAIRFHPPLLTGLSRQLPSKSSGRSRCCPRDGQGRSCRLPSQGLTD